MRYCMLFVVGFILGAVMQKQCDELSRIMEKLEELRAQWEIK